MKLILPARHTSIPVIVQCYDVANDDGRDHKLSIVFMDLVRYKFLFGSGMDTDLEGIVTKTETKTATTDSR
jgi:hypothetical protein